MFGVPLGELLWLAGAILVGGVVTGILAGLFGVGGGAVIVPILYEVFRTIGVPGDVRVQLCVGTSLAIIVATSIRSFRAHRARGGLPLEILHIWAPPVVLGVAVGSLIAAVAPGWVFKLVFVVMALLIAAKLLFARKTWRLGSRLPGRPLMTAYGFAIGLYASLMGVGGGALSNLLLTLYDIPIHAAVGISAGLGMFISIAGTVGYALAGLSHQAAMPPLSIGFVSFLGVLLMAPVTALVAPYGARLAHSLSRRQLEVAFGIFLLVVAARFTASLTGWAGLE